MTIREYTPQDETGWVRCRLISFLDCSYYDDVMRQKETYQNPSVCAVAEENGKIVGLLDAEYELETGAVCHFPGGKGAVIWHLGVLPEYRKIGTASKLWEFVRQKLLALGITRVEVWTQDDEPANRWYQKQGFVLKESYLNAYVRGTSKDNSAIQKYVNLQNIGDIFGVRCLNFEAPLERKAELAPLCYCLYEVRGYEMQL